MKKVYVVLRGEDCEGAWIEAVFEKNEDAIKYLDEKYTKWLKIAPDDRRSTYVFDGKVCEGCTSAFVEEWDVK